MLTANYCHHINQLRLINSVSSSILQTLLRIENLIKIEVDFDILSEKKKKTHYDYLQLSYWDKSRRPSVVNYEIRFFSFNEDGIFFSFEEKVFSTMLFIHQHQVKHDTRVFAKSMKW